MLLLSSLIFCYKALLDAMFVLDFPGDSASKGLTCQGRQCGFISWVEKFPWRRKWQPTPCSFWEIPLRKEPGRLQSTGSQRVRHDCAAEHSAATVFVLLVHSEFLMTIDPVCFLLSITKNN